MENQDKNVAVVPAEEGGDRRPSRLIQSVPVQEAFGGWGPKMVGSLRDVLRGMN